MLNELGSAVVQNIKFRDAWAFVGQKGIKGFSDLEQVSHVITGAFVSVLTRCNISQ